MGKKAEVRKKGSRYDKSVIEDLEQEDPEKKDKQKAAVEAVEDEPSKGKSKGRFHLMFDM